MAKLFESSYATLPFRVTDYERTYVADRYQYIYSYSGTMTITSSSLADDDSDTTGRGLATETKQGYASGQPYVKSDLLHDKAGRVTQRIFYYYNESDSPDRSVTAKMVYDDQGRMTASIADGDSDLTTSYTYDGAGRRLEVENPEGNTTTYTYGPLWEFKGVRHFFWVFLSGIIGDVGVVEKVSLILYNVITIGGCFQGWRHSCDRHTGALAGRVVCGGSVVLSDSRRSHSQAGGQGFGSVVAA